MKILILLLPSLFFACSNYDSSTGDSSLNHHLSYDQYTIYKHFDFEGDCYSFDTVDKLEVLNTSQITEARATSLARAKLNKIEPGKCLESFTCIKPGARPVWNWVSRSLKVVGVELIKSGHENLGFIGGSDRGRKISPRMPLFCK